MDLSPLAKAIGDRLASDTGSGGLLNSGNELIATTNGIANTFSVFSTQAPRIVFQFTSIVPSTAFKKEIVTVDIDVVTFAPSTGGDALTASRVSYFTRANAIRLRIYGDSAAQSYGQPTYGLHRWTPTLSGTSWTADTLQHFNTIEAHEEGVYVYHDEFRTLMRL